jgi:hypothetical protein
MFKLLITTITYSGTNQTASSIVESFDTEEKRRQAAIKINAANERLTSPRLGDRTFPHRYFCVDLN